MKAKRPASNTSWLDGHGGGGRVPSWVLGYLNNTIGGRGGADSSSTAQGDLNHQRERPALQHHPSRAAPETALPSLSWRGSKEGSEQDDEGGNG